MARIKAPRIKTSLPKILFILAVVFLAAQAFTGEQGLLRWRQYVIKADALEAQKKQLIQKRISLETKISRLKSNKVDADYLEEVAITKMGMANPNDKIIEIPKGILEENQGQNINVK